ncbi:putative redox protein [Rhizobiales bacterium GAS191]|nr:putative redox protein [Rhizobiales bacterium GAS191]
MNPDEANPAATNPVQAKRDPSALREQVTPGSVIVASTGQGALQQALLDGRHMLLADEPASAGGGDTGPGPYELLLMALGSCSSMTVHLYAGRKNWPLQQVIVTLRHERVHAEDCANCADPKARIDRIHKRIELIGSLDDTQRARLVEIANQCPVHRTLTSKIDIRTELVA